MLDVVRKACRPAIWSQGVKLAREGSVSKLSTGKGEAMFRVRAATHVVAPTVTLYFDDEEWSCDCGGKVDPCTFSRQDPISTLCFAQAVSDSYRLGGRARNRSVRAAGPLAFVGQWIMFRGPEFDEPRFPSGRGADLGQ